MKAVWKYVLDRPVNEILIPYGAPIIHVHQQNNDPCIWALVEPGRESLPRTFSVYGTGQTLRLGYHHDYMGSAHIDCGRIVLHVFEEFENG